MLAQTTLSDYLHLASVTEFAVYLGGLLAVILLPGLLLGLAKKPTQSSQDSDEASGE
jgi:hypothetical protein